MKKKQRKKEREPVNNTGIPQYAIERFARCVFDDIRADFERPEIQEEYRRWLEEREGSAFHSEE